MSMAGYTKLFNSILASTIWRSTHETRIVWITMLAMADKNGIVEASIPGLADFARVDLSACETAIKELSSPDEYSRTSEHDGRRIEIIDGVGWRLLNHSKYRAKLSEDERREYNRQKQAEWRKRQKMSNNVIDSQSQSAMSAQAEADTEADTDTKTEREVDKPPSRKRFVKPTIPEIREYCEEIGATINPATFFNHYETVGWKVGKNSMKDWKAAVRGWNSRENK